MYSRISKSFNDNDCIYPLNFVSDKNIPQQML